jgi:leucine dehydrogenase
MNVLSGMQAQGHEEVVFFSDPATGLRSIVAIHDTTLGPAVGGARMWVYPSEEAALEDVLRLAKAMTYKAAVAGLDLGGGKGLIIGDPRKDKTEALLRAYARAVDSLGGRYITAEDVGTTPEDLEVFMQETRWMVGRPLEAGGSGDSAPLTAYGVFQGMRACALEVFGDGSVEGKTVAIQGFGKVASNLARYLKEDGARLVVTEIDPRARDRAASEFGARIVEPEAIYNVDCDIFAPCALGGVLTEETVPRLRCGIVAGGANNQLADPGVGEQLRRAGILYAPDYVINAGGLINLSFELTMYDPEAARVRVKGIFDTMTGIITTAKQDGVSTADAADRMALARLDAARANRLS